MAKRRGLDAVRPDQVHNPIGLVLRTLRDGGRSGRAAVAQAGLALAANPIDRALERQEHTVHPAAAAPTKPVIIVVGPPRSGTTIVAQTIARRLPVSHLTNLTAMFPRAPLSAARFFRIHPDAAAVSGVSHYGRTASLGDHNDALPLWDRWLGGDRSSLTIDLSPEQRRQLQRFFGTYEQTYGRAVVAKNNNLIAHADTIGAALPTAVFLCMTRDRLELAQSLLIARRQITGDERVPYGLHPDRANADADVLVDVARQIDFYDELAARQLGRLGPDRFRMVSYDDFCNDPARLLHTLAVEVLGFDAPPPAAVGLTPLTRSAGDRIDPSELHRLRSLLGVARSTS